MARTLNDFGMQRIFPPPAKYPVTVIGVEKGISQKKKTPQITLIFSDGENEFDDQLYVTEKTIPRLALVAKRVCGMDEKTELPDSDIDAANFLASEIMQTVKGKDCIVRIEETEEIIIPETGPDAGRKKTIKRRRVAFNGYERYVEQAPDRPQPGTDASDDLPF